MTETFASDILQVADLTAGYSLRDVLKQVTFAVPAGAIVGVVGANGAGKTTLLRTISGMIKPRRGSVRFEGRNVLGLPVESIARLGLMHLPEGRGLFANLTVEENLRLFSRSSDFPARSKEVFEYFPEIEPRLHQPVVALSGGEQQMVALARGWISQPRFLMIDELTLGLAPTIVQRLSEFLVTLNKRGTAVLLVEESLQVVFRLARWVYVLKDGSIAVEGSTADLRNRYQELIDAYLSKD